MTERNSRRANDLLQVKKLNYLTPACSDEYAQSARTILTQPKEEVFKADPASPAPLKSFREVVDGSVASDSMAWIKNLKTSALKNFVNRKEDYSDEP